MHTVGAKTGKARTTSVTYARNGGDYLVVALQRRRGTITRVVPQPEAESRHRNQCRAKAFGGDSSPVLPGDPDRERLWKVVTKRSKSYDECRKRTQRPFPIVRLTPKC